MASRRGWQCTPFWMATWVNKKHPQAEFEQRLFRNATIRAVVLFRLKTILQHIADNMCRLHAEKKRVARIQPYTCIETCFTLGKVTFLFDSQVSPPLDQSKILPCPRVLQPRHTHINIYIYKCIISYIYILFFLKNNILNNIDNIDIIMSRFS